MDRKKQLDLLVPVHHVVAFLGGSICRAFHWRAVVSAWASSRVIGPTSGGTGGHVNWAADGKIGHTVQEFVGRSPVDL